MIAKRQRDITHKESSFKDLAEYILRTHKKEKEIDGYRITHCGFNDDQQLAIQEVLAVQARNTTAKSDPCYHLTFAFPAGEKPDRKTLDAIEDELCEAIGLQNHQRISAIHNDTDHYHVHVAINKIHPQTFNITEPYFDKLKLVDACEQLEIKHGLVKQIDWDAAKAKREAGIKGEDQRLAAMKAHTGQLPFKDWVVRRKSLITEAIDEANGWNDLHKRLARFDLTIKARGNGAVLMARTTGVHIKLSELGREYTKAKLEKRLGKLQPANQEAQATESVSRYSKQPLQPNAQKSDLYKEFLARQETRKIALADIRRRRKSGYENLKQENQKRRAAIKADRLLPGRFKFQAYQTLAATMKKARSEHKERMNAEQSAIYAQYPERNWTMYLMQQAEQGNDEALKRLRWDKKNNGLAEKLAITGEQRTDSDSIFKAMQPKVGKSGVVEYQHKGTTIRDNGDMLATDSSERAAVLALLRMARQQYGDHLQVISQDEQFKQTVIEVAVAEQIPVSFDDPKMERKRQVLEAALQEGKRNRNDRFQQNKNHQKPKNTNKNKGYER